MARATQVHDIKTLILSRHPVIIVETVEEGRVEGLLREVGGLIQLPIFDWTLTGGLRRRPSPPQHGTAEPSGLLRHLGAMNLEAVFWLKDFSRHLKDPNHSRLFRELSQRFERTRSTVVLTGSSVEVPDDIEHKAVYFELKLPSRDELREVLESVIQSMRIDHPFVTRLRPGDLTELLQALSGMTLSQARRTVAYAILEDGKLDSEDVARIVRRKAELLREKGLLEFYPPEEEPCDLGGFSNLKDWLGRAEMGFKPEAARYNLSPPRGILLVGIQGCGKSLAAKVIARKWRLPLIKLDVGTLFDKYIGETEKNFRRAVAQAESMAPCVLWIDEIEKAFSAGGGDQDGGLSRRLLGGFLTWMQEKRQDVFLAATANDLFSLPPELLRKGRFDEIFFVDLPDESERRTILSIHLERHKLSAEGFDLQALAAASQGFSGAELEQSVVSALYRALHLKKPLDTDLLLLEIRETVPLSVSRKEDIQALRTTARERFVPVSRPSAVPV